MHGWLITRKASLSSSRSTFLNPLDRGKGADMLLPPAVQGYLQGTESLSGFLASYEERVGNGYTQGSISTGRHRDRSERRRNSAQCSVSSGCIVDAWM